MCRFVKVEKDRGSQGSAPLQVTARSDPKTRSVSHTRTQLDQEITINPLEHPEIIPSRLKKEEKKRLMLQQERLFCKLQLLLLKVEYNLHYFLKKVFIFFLNHSMLLLVIWEKKRVFII